MYKFFKDLKITIENSNLEKPQIFTGVKGLWILGLLLVLSLFIFSLIGTTITSVILWTVSFFTSTIGITLLLGLLITYHYKKISLDTLISKIKNVYQKTKQEIKEDINKDGLS